MEVCQNCKEYVWSAETNCPNCNADVQDAPPKHTPNSNNIATRLSPKLRS
jgi:hypothetical protein